MSDSINFTIRHHSKTTFNYYSRRIPTLEGAGLRARENFSCCNLLSFDSSSLDFLLTAWDTARKHQLHCLLNRWSFHIVGANAFKYNVYCRKVSTAWKILTFESLYTNIAHLSLPQKFATTAFFFQGRWRCGIILILWKFLRPRSRSCSASLGWLEGRGRRNNEWKVVPISLGA